MIKPAIKSEPRSIDPTKTHEVADFVHEIPLTCCKVDPTGRFVFAGAEDLNVYGWDISTGNKITLIGHESWVRSMDFSPDGQRLYTAGWDGQLRYWSINEGQPESMHTIQAHHGFARWIHTSPGGRMLATCGNDKFIRVWDESTGRRMVELSGHDRHPYAVCFHPTDGRLVSQDLMGTVFVWDARTNRRTDAISTIMTGYDNKFAADMGGARDMHFRADGSLLACAGITNVVNSFAGQQDPVIAIIDWTGKNVTHHLQAADKKPGIMWGVRFHPDGFIVGAVAQQNGKGALLFWRLADAVEPDKAEKRKSDEAQADGKVADAQVADAIGNESTVGKGKPVEVKSFHAMSLSKSARGLDLTPDHRRVAVAHADGHLRIYELAEQVETKETDESA